MKIRILFTLQSDASGQKLEDTLRWPDCATIEEVAPHVTAYLNKQYGEGQYELDDIEEVSA